MRRTVLLALLLAAMPGRRAAAEPSINHTVEAGDTLPLLAAEYYGDRNHMVFIMVANHMDHEQVLVPGSVLKIPISDEITVKAGDSWESLAARHLGSEKRAEFLAQFNGSTAAASIPAGEVIQIPLRITYTADRVTLLADLAITYLGDRDKGGFLGEYNDLPGDSIEAGQSVIIPIARVRVRRDKLPAPDAEEQALVDKRRRMQELATRALPEARAAWHEGDYHLIRNELTKIELEYVDGDTAMALGLLLGGAYVAFDDDDSALALFRKLVARDREHALDAAQVSPKIRRVWQLAGGKVTEPKK
ncbi:MAG TPA: LysM peptidoglycan-binding domain-containing protein [Kofleriaceae bacterium]|nr:LysM peptidoglycan-binding domain-containing protein [Kofleriaceae bacterium]